MVVWLLGLAQAQSLHGFVGTWRFDAAASESVGPLLAAQGVAWPLRTLAASARPTLEVTPHEGGLRITTHDSRGQREDHVTPDGVARSSSSRTGPVTCASTWVDTALQTDCSMAGGTLRVTRAVSGDVWTQQIVFTPSEGTGVSARRIFRR